MWTENKESFYYCQGVLSPLYVFSVEGTPRKYHDPKILILGHIMSCEIKPSQLKSRKVTMELGRKSSHSSGYAVRFILNNSASSQQHIHQVGRSKGQLAPRRRAENGMACAHHQTPPFDWRWASYHPGRRGVGTWASDILCLLTSVHKEK